jgi:hypothetical protein
MSGESYKTKVIILTRHYRIIGHIHMQSQARVTDYICDSMNFIAVTDAEIWDLDQRKVATTSFLNISRKHIETVMPEDCIKKVGGMQIS